MRILVTGAGGFLGRFIAAEAAARGHEVRAMTRSKAPVESASPGKVETVVADLRSRRSLARILDGVDSVIHAAAGTGGDFYEQFGDTVIGTENLLNAMQDAGVTKITLISSFSVYDYKRKWSFSKFDESAPLETSPEKRDDYCFAKLEQENLLREFASQRNWEFSIIRPGVIYGPGRYWTPLAGMRVGRKFVFQTGIFGRLPLTYVENCAEAILDIAELSGCSGEAYNVVDDSLPTRRRYIRALGAAEGVRLRRIPIPFVLLRALTACAAMFNFTICRNLAKVPSLLKPGNLHARCKPLTYDNRKLSEATGWKPKYGFSQAIGQSVNTASNVT